MPKTRLTEWQRKTLRYFDSQPKKVFMYRDLTAIIFQQTYQLNLPKSISTSRFVEFLMKDDYLKEITVSRDSDKPASHESEGQRRKDITRYVWRSASAYEVALSLRPNSYLSHASALFLLGLTDQIPQTAYANKEQSPKPPPERNSLSQQSLDRAFQNQPRKSRYAYLWGEFRIILLSGKNTNRLEVTQINTPEGAMLDVTKLERTLIDATVRPFYVGGIFQVLEAFRAARERMSVNTLIATLRRLDYVYPYHQAIGFYMERAGYDSKQLDKIRSLGLEYDFYLSYAMGDTTYSSDWRLHHPQGL